MLCRGRSRRFQVLLDFPVRSLMTEHRIHQPLMRDGSSPSATPLLRATPMFNVSKPSVRPNWGSGLSVLTVRGTVRAPSRDELRLIGRLEITQEARLPAPTPLAKRNKGPKSPLMETWQPARSDVPQESSSCHGNCDKTFQKPSRAIQLHFLELSKKWRVARHRPIKIEPQCL
jgi:hypothetical protein